MTISTVELALAKEATRILLDELGLAAYLFEVEPRNDAWELRLDCAVADGWQSLRLPLDKAKLLTSLEDPAARADLLAAWRARLASCKVG